MLEVQYENDPRDLPPALRAVPWRRRLSWRAGFWLTMGLSALAPTLLLAALGNWNALAAGWSVWALLALYLRYKVWSSQRAALRAASARFRPVTLRIWPERIESRTERGLTNCDWLTIDYVARGRQHLVLVTRFLTFHVVPIRAFGSPEQAETFFQAAHEYHRRAHERGTPQFVPAVLPPEDDSLRIVYRNTPAELMRLHSEGLPRKGQRPRKQLSWRAALLLALTGIVTVFIAAGQEPQQSIVGLLSFMLLSLATMVSIRWLPLWLIRSIFERTCAGEKTLTISAGGVSRVDPDCESFIAWQEFSSIEEDEQLIVFFQNDRTHMAHVIPKQAFATPADVERFMSTAERLYQRSQPTPELPHRQETGNPYQSPVAR